MKENAKLARNITLLGAFIDLVLGATKVAVGYVYHSQALISDGVHSLSDLISDFFVLIMSKISHSDADENHPYGHGKFENIGTIVIGILLIGIAIGMAFDNYEKLFSANERPKPGYITLGIALLSVIGKEWIYRKTKAVGEKIKSPMIIANAWHSRTDAISSIFVFVGLILSIFLNPKIDLLLAFAVSVYIGKIGFDFIKQALIGLVDTGLDEGVVKGIEDIVLGVDGVKSFHNLRSRRMGNKAIVDINIEVNPLISVSEGHQIATWVARSIMDEVEDIYDVTVHTDVEDDRIEGEERVSHEHKLMPLRSNVLSAIKESLSQQEFSEIHQLNLHYLENKLLVELILKNRQDISHIEQKILECEFIDKVQFLFL